MTMIIRLIIAALLFNAPALAANPGSDRVLGVAEGGTGTTNGPAAVPFIAPGGTNAATPAQRASHALNFIDDFGAKGDCSTDDGPAFNTAITTIVSTVAKGGRLYLPTPPGGCYLFKTMGVLPGQNGSPWRYSVEIFGDGPATVVRAGAVMDAVIEKDNVYNRGYTLHDFTIDANKMATHAFRIIKGGDLTAHHMWFTRAATGGSNVLVNDGENTFHHNYFQNKDSDFSGLSDLPAYALDVQASDNHFTDNILWNAAACQVNDKGVNRYVANHAYGYPVGYLAPVNFCAGGASIWIGNNADTATDSGFNITGYGAHLVGNHAQGSSIGTTPVGFKLAAGVQDVVLVGNWSDMGSVTTPIQQSGSAGVNTVVFANAGSTSSGAVYSNMGPIISGQGNNTSTNILGVLGSYNTVRGNRSFAIGSGVNDQYRSGCFLQAGGAISYMGDNQTVVCQMTGQGTSGTVNILAGNTNGASGVFNTNEIAIRTDIQASMLVRVDLHANCSTGDTAAWTTAFVMKANKSAASAAFVSTPTWSQIAATSGASGWTPAVVLDTTNGGAYLTGTGACAGGKTIYWNARVTTVETASGAN
jgi:hypothetical protein